MLPNYSSVPLPPPQQPKYFPDFYFLFQPPNAFLQLEDRRIKGILLGPPSCTTFLFRLLNRGDLRRFAECF